MSQDCYSKETKSTSPYFVSTMGKDDKIPIIVEEKAPTKTKCRKSLAATISISCALAATLIVLVVVGSLYIDDLKHKLQHDVYGEEANENSASMQWKRYQQEQKTRRVRTNHPEMTAEAEQVWLDTKGDLDLGHINGKPVAIYRKDLEENYIAYWELPVDNNQYIIISAGKRTGDRKRVAQGNLPSMTQFVDNKALEYGRECFSYYMMAPSGEIMCDDNNGRIVATSLDEEILTDSNYPDPHEYIENHLSALEVTWIKHAYDVSTSGEWDDEDVSQTDSQEADEVDKDSEEDEDNDDEDSEEYSESPAVPGHPIIIAVGNVNKLRDINIRYQPGNSNETVESIHETQFNLCQCSRVCDDEDMYAVKRSLLKVDNDTGLGYLRFEICKSARDLFSGNEISFTVEISGTDGTFLRKRFGLEYESSRKRRFTEYKPWSSWTYTSIPHEKYFPDYKQFKVGSCAVGCASVAWAQIFAYFDRRSHYVTSTYGTGSQPLYRSGSDGTTGSSSKVAPKYTSDNRIRGYTKKLAKTLGTWCLFGNGATIYKKMKKVSGFFKARQTSGSPALHDRSYWLSITGIYYSKIASWARGYLKKGWPVIAGTREGGVFKQHYAVATKYRVRSRKYRKCVKIFGKKICLKWKTKTDIDMYTHQGWGGSKNRWRNMEMWYAVAATY